jgi:O-antigen/teichoic acid export membrane protein
MKRVHRGTLRSHAALSLSASAVSALVTLFTLPYIVDGLGLERYGLFSLLILASAYVGVLDLGFSWTSSRFVAEALERQDDAMLDDVLSSSLVLYAGLGVLGCAILALAAPFLVVHVFSAPSDLQDPGVRAARLFAFAFPAAMAQTYAAAVLRGAQRFDLTTALQTISAVGTSAAIVGVIAAGAGIVGVAAAVAVVQCVGAAFGLACVRWTLPMAFRPRMPSLRAVALLGRFTSKVAVTNLGLQLLYLPNRLAVGVLLPLSAVARFTVPLSLAQRLQVVPSALVSAALPTLTAEFARGDDRRFRQTVWRLAGANAVLLAPVSLLALLWAPTLLEIWFSNGLGDDAAAVLRITIAAVLLNAVTSVLVVACDSSGAPGLPALAAVIAGAANVVLAFALTAVAGIIGAAVALLASLVLLTVVILVGWRGRGLPHLRPLPRPDRRRVISGALAASVWAAAVWFAEAWVDDRASLVIWALILLVVAYLAIAGVAGREAITRWASGREASVSA